MKKVLILFFVWAFVSQNLIASDSLFAQSDKKKHMIVSVAISGAVTAFARNKGYSRTESFFMGVGVSMLIGLAKEEIDGHRTNGTKDFDDLKADLIGSVSGALVSAQFEWKF